MPLPCVVGFDEETAGTFMSYINDLGLIGIAYEAGEHYALESIDNNVAFIWFALSKLGCIDKDQIPDYQEHHDRLAGNKVGRHTIFDLVYRHSIRPEDEFKMRPGYTTFDKIEKGEHLADDKNGKVLAQYDGNIFMPLYQSQGDDGYFIVQERSKKWLDLSEKLRVNRDDEYLLGLPEVELYEDDIHTITVPVSAYDDIRDRLHLMGFRRKRVVGDKYVITRRVYDVSAAEVEVG